MNYIVHPRIVPGKVEERMYQVSMARGCVTSNTLLILPTGLGKTIVAVNVTADFLSKGRILLMAPTKPLVEQHFEEFSNLLVDADIGVITGNMKPERRAELMSTCDVVISTPQSVANDLEAGRYDLSGFSLIIYDEAHRGTGNYAYVRVARFKEKNTRSVGMTASPGSDAGKIEEVCMNLGSGA